MRRFLYTLAIAAIVIPAAWAQDEYDDIYYNPRSSKESNQKSSKKKQSNYIANFSEMDVDDYNRRGFYYETPVDTIGANAENAEDFVYTQQIQKYYNPTIVVDNADVLEDLLENSYGNVDIVIENGAPVFTSIYTGGYAWTPVYYNWAWRPSWTWSYGWGPWNVSWNWGPSWAWGPSWTWGPSWSWGPSWAWGPSWGWGYPGWGYDPWRPVPRPPHYHHHYAYDRPGAGRPVRPNPGWSGNTRPGGNYAGSMARPGSRGDRPMGSTTTSANRNPYGRNSQAVTSKRYNSATLNGELTKTERPNRVTGGSVPKRSDKIGSAADRATTSKNVTIQTNRQNSIDRSQTTTTNKRSYNTNRTTTTNNRSYNTNRTTTNNRSYNTNRTTTTNNRSYNTNRSSSSSRSYSTGRSSGSRSTGGSRGGGGSHGGGRGGRR